MFYCLEVFGKNTQKRNFLCLCICLGCTVIIIGSWRRLPFWNWITIPKEGSCKHSHFCPLFHDYFHNSVLNWWLFLTVVTHVSHTLQFFFVWKFDTDMQNILCASICSLISINYVIVLEVFWKNAHFYVYAFFSANFSRLLIKFEMYMYFWMLYKFCFNVI